LEPMRIEGGDKEWEPVLADWQIEPSDGGANRNFDREEWVPREEQLQ